VQHVPTSVLCGPGNELYARKVRVYDGNIDYPPIVQIELRPDVGIRRLRECNLSLDGILLAVRGKVSFPFPREYTIMKINILAENIVG